MQFDTPHVYVYVRIATQLALPALSCDKILSVPTLPY